MASKLQLLDLPNELISQIFSNLKFHEIARIRIVCRRFNETSQKLLNLGFRRVIRYHETCQKYISARMPQKESERRNHPLVNHIAVLSAVETRISILSLTYGELMEFDICCFIPGKVLDELFYLLRVVQINRPLEPNSLLQNLRDITSMAIEHFEEHVRKSFLTGNLSSNKKKYNDEIKDAVYFGGLRELEFSTITLQFPGNLPSSTGKTLISSTAALQQTPKLFRVLAAFERVPKDTMNVTTMRSISPMRDDKLATSDCKQKPKRTKKRRKCKSSMRRYQNRKIHYYK